MVERKVSLEQPNCTGTNAELVAYDRAHRRIEARLSPPNPKGEDDSCLHRPKGMRQRTFARLWAELDRNEDVLNERLVRVAARLMRWAR
jgi:hypothetical protein